MLALSLSDKVWCFGIFVFVFVFNRFLCSCFSFVLVFIIFVFVLVFVNEFVIFSFFNILVFVFVNENHTGRTITSFVDGKGTVCSCTGSTMTWETVHSRIVWLATARPTVSTSTLLSVTAGSTTYSPVLDPAFLPTTFDTPMDGSVSCSAVSYTHLTLPTILRV